MNPSFQSSTLWLLRLSLASAFMSAVIDRLGGWGPPGTPNVAWGAWAPFVGYTGQLLWFLPASLVNAAAIGATLAEAVLAVWLVVGFRLREAALASAALLLSFGLSMTLAMGVKAPLNYSVFTAAAAALALACLAQPLAAGKRKSR
ncbi:MAG: hypothetical protein JWO94_837 [Verrucomicrobiaceae bacterium]|nr:hypothetical protein [Verrucomicrobiaceae bacterium]